MTASPHTLVPTLGQTDCLRRLRVSITQPGAVSIVTGGHGLGKSTLLAALVDAAPFPVITLDAADARTDLHLLRAILAGLGAAPSGRSGIDLLTEISRVLATADGDDPRLVIAIDDAHHLTGSQLDVLRGILTLPLPAGRQPGLVLVGEPGLLDRLQRRSSLVERIAMQHTLNPLNPADAAALFTDLTRTLPPVTDDALALVVTATDGVPANLVAAASNLADAARRDGLTQIDLMTARAALGLDRPDADRRLQTRLPLDLFGSGVGMGEQV